VNRFALLALAVALSGASSTHRCPAARSRRSEVSSSSCLAGHPATSTHKRSSLEVLAITAAATKEAASPHATPDDVSGLTIDNAVEERRTPPVEGLL